MNNLVQHNWNSDKKSTPEIFRGGFLIAFIEALFIEYGRKGTIIGDGFLMRI